MRIVAIRGVRLGEGIPKIIVPLCGDSAAELLSEAARLGKSAADIIEWRIDTLHGAQEADVILALLPDIRAALGEKPLLVTCRTRRDGGSGTDDPAAYCRLNTALCRSGQIDLIDLELSAGSDIVKAMIAAAHENHVAAIVSWHNFSVTPPQAEMVDKLRRMQALGADIAKLAAMPHSRADVAALLAATAEMADHHAETPVITMSMGQLGVISRLSCEAFGSAATFASAGHISAPGQPQLEPAKDILSGLHSMLAE